MILTRMLSWYTDPHPVVAVVLLLVGFFILIKGANLLVEGGVALAKRFHLSMAVIGATIVAFGTSLPELVVSIGSSIKAVQLGSGGDPEGPAAIAVANIVGSNIFNIGAILGLSALFTRLLISRSTRRLDYPLMLAAFALFIIFCLPIGGPPQVGRWEGLVLMCGLVAFTFLAIKFGKVPVDPNDIPDPGALSVGKASALIGLGVVLLTVGGDAALNGAITLAETLGMSNRLIGLTVMAIGTSLPELVTSIQAARKGHADLAVANVIGSNLFNILCIIGISALILPLPVADSILHWDFYWMAGFAVLLAPLLLRRGSEGRPGGIGRPAGILLVCALVVYITLTMLNDPGQPLPDATPESAKVGQPASDTPTLP